MDNPLIAFRMSVAPVAKYTRTPAPGNITAAPKHTVADVKRQDQIPAQPRSGIDHL